MSTVLTSKQRIAPGPSGNLLFGSLPAMQRDPLKLFREARQQYGDVVRFRSFYPYFWHMISHPDDIDRVLRTNVQNYPKSFFTRHIGTLVGEGLLTSEGETWRQQRRLAQPAFHRSRLAALGETMTRSTEAMLDRWAVTARNGQPLDVSVEMMQLTLQIVGLTLFSVDVSGAAEEVGEAMTVALEHINYGMMHMFALPNKVPTPRNLRFKRALHTIDEMVSSIIAERRRTSIDQGDLLSMLLLARDEETGAGMSDQLLLDEAKTIVLAGHETTANALTWAWYLLSQHPTVEDNLHAELQAVLGGRTPTLEDLPKLTYTRMVIDETLRLYPPAWTMGRQLREDDEMQGYHIPGHSLIIFSQYVTHRHPEFWEQPTRFFPEHFTPERTAQRPRFAYFPFGGGLRQCIGNNFALMEAQLILATIAQRYRPRLVPGHPVIPEPTVTLRPKHGMLMRI